MKRTNLSKSVPIAIALTGSLVFSSVTLAQDNDNSSLASSVFDGWTGTASLGATSSTGNSEASNINGSLRIGKTVNKWQHLVFGSVFKGSSSIVVTDTDQNGDPLVDPDTGFVQRRIVKGDNSDRLALSYQPKYFIRSKTYLFGLLGWEQDEPANIDTATRQIFGVGHEFFADQSGFLTAEIGLGNKTTDLVVGDDLNGAVGYLGLNYLNRITDEVTFNADLRSDFGSDNTYIELGLGIAFKVSDKIAFKVSHFSRSNSDLSSGDSPLSSNSDSVTTFNLVLDI